MAKLAKLDKFRVDVSCELPHIHYVNMQASRFSELEQENCEYGTIMSISDVNWNRPYCDNRSVSGATVGLLDQITQYQYCNLSYISLSESHLALRNYVPQSQTRLCCLNARSVANRALSF